LELFKKEKKEDFTYGVTQSLIKAIEETEIGVDGSRINLEPLDLSM